MFYLTVWYPNHEKTDRLYLIDEYDDYRIVERLDAVYGKSPEGQKKKVRKDPLSIDELRNMGYEVLSYRKIRGRSHGEIEVTLRQGRKYLRYFFRERDAGEPDREYEPYQCTVNQAHAEYKFAKGEARLVPEELAFPGWQYYKWDNHKKNILYEMPEGGIPENYAESLSL